MKLYLNLRFSSTLGALVVVGIYLKLELHIWPVQQQKFIFFPDDVSMHSVLLHEVSVKHPFKCTLDSPEIETITLSNMNLSEMTI